MSKKVQFSCDIEFISTFDNEEYDRTAQEVSKLTYKDMLELLTMKSQWRRDMERMLQAREEQEIKSDESSNDDSDSSNDTGDESYNTSIQDICI